MLAHVLLPCLLFAVAVFQVQSEDIVVPEVQPQEAPSEWLQFLLPHQPKNIFNLKKTVRVSQANNGTSFRDTCTCGVLGSNRIVGGQLAGANEYPWQILLLVDEKFICGASLLDSNWAITAAHCVYNSSQVFLYMGFTDVTKIDNSTFVTRAQSVKIHNDYKSVSVDKNIALLKLTTPAPLSSTISPICLPYKYPTLDFKNLNATVTGWGATRYGGTPSNNLREVVLKVINQSQCTRRPYLWSSMYVTNTMLCMTTLRRDSCQGDYGGPVNWRSSQVYLIGIGSFGYRCALRPYPSVYTKVNDYLSWITTTTGKTFCEL